MTETNLVITVEDEVCGGCPRCGGCTDLYEVDFTHFGFCAEHKLKWPWIGDLRDLDERPNPEATLAEWKENEAFLTEFEQVRGLPQGIWPRDEATQRQALAARDAVLKRKREERGPSPIPF